MKKRVYRWMAIGFTVCIILGMTGCSKDTSKIKDTLSEFEYACKHLDVDAMLACIDPSVSDPIRMGLAIFSNFTDADYEDVVDSIFGNVVRDESDVEFNSEDFLSTVTITDAKLKKEKDTAIITCKLNFEISGEQFHRDTTISMIKKNDKWYIAGFDMFS